MFGTSVIIGSVFPYGFQIGYILTCALMLSY
jgi:hypothetical protein